MVAFQQNSTSVKTSISKQVVANQEKQNAMSIATNRLISTLFELTYKALYAQLSNPKDHSGFEISFGANNKIFWNNDESEDEDDGLDGMWLVDFVAMKQTKKDLQHSSGYNAAVGVLQRGSGINAAAVGTSGVSQCGSGINVAAGDTSGLLQRGSGINAAAGGTSGVSQCGSGINAAAGGTSGVLQCGSGINAASEGDDDEICVNYSNYSSLINHTPREGTVLPYLPDDNID
jgi:hypothetical protein